MQRSRTVALAAAVVLGLAACGASDEEEVARVLESYPHSLAAGDAKAACAAFSPETRRERGGALCDHLRESVARITPDGRRR